MGNSSSKRGQAAGDGVAVLPHDVGELGAEALSRLIDAMIATGGTWVLSLRLSSQPSGRAVSDAAAMWRAWSQLQDQSEGVILYERGRVDRDARLIIYGRPGSNCTEITGELCEGGALLDELPTTAGERLFVKMYTSDEEAKKVKYAVAKAKAEAAKKPAAAAAAALAAAEQVEAKAAAAGAEAAMAV